MGEEKVFQILTREDRITVLLYRAGIVASMLVIGGMAYLSSLSASTAHRFADMLLYCLQASVGMSVFFIHLYIGKFKIFLKNLYYLSLACLGALVLLGNGSPSSAVLQAPAASLLLLPLSGCLGFVTAKEAFCFRLFEGYLLAMIMPAYLVLVAAHALGQRGAVSGLILIASLLVLFTLRKVFMPIAYDIGDKSAYR